MAAEPISLHIRSATPADADRLIPLINAAFAVETFLQGPRTDPERLSAAMRKGTILLAEDREGRLAASIYVELRGDRGYAGMLAVDPARQRSGIGAQMMAAAEDHLRRQGFTALDITVLSYGRSCRRFIASSGLWRRARKSSSIPTPSRAGKSATAS